MLENLEFARQEIELFELIQVQNDIVGVGAAGAGAASTATAAATATADVVLLRQEAEEEEAEDDDDRMLLSPPTFDNSIDDEPSPKANIQVQEPAAASSSCPGLPPCHTGKPSFCKKLKMGELKTGEMETTTKKKRAPGCHG